jgi:hypothetical protein
LTPDPQRRRALIADVFTENAGYTDPLLSVRGHAAIDQFVAGAQAQFAGLQFSLGSLVDCPAIRDVYLANVFVILRRHDEGSVSCEQPRSRGSFGFAQDDTKLVKPVNRSWTLH